VIAEQKDKIINIWAEMKGWTYLNKQGIQLDTLRILIYTESIKTISRKRRVIN